jgi:hypothetical protein
MSWPRLRTAILAILPCARRRLPAHELIRFFNKDGGNCVCLVVCCKVGREHHVAFVSVPGSPSQPAANIEGLASSVFRDMGAPTASLVFWDVDRHQWDDGITIHRVEFLSLIDGRFSGPKWIPETLPHALAKQIARAQYETSTGTAPAGGRQ